MPPKPPRLATGESEVSSAAGIAPLTLQRHRGASEPTDPLSDDDTLMDWEGISPTTATAQSPLKRKRMVMDYVLMSPRSLLNDQAKSSSSADPDDPPPRKKTQCSLLSGAPRRSARNLPKVEPEEPQRTFRDIDVATSPSPPESPSSDWRDSVGADLESSLDAILNQLAEETQRREALQEQYAAFGDGESWTEQPREPPSLSPSLDFTVFDRRDDEELFESLFHTSNDDLQESLAAGMDAELRSQFEELPKLKHFQADDDPPPPADFPSPIMISPFLAIEPDNVSSIADHELEGNPNVHSLDFNTWWAQLDEIANEDELWSNSEPTPDDGAARSRCPCNQCSPQVPPYPDYRKSPCSVGRYFINSIPTGPSRHSQQEIHRLFHSGPFACSRSP
ncbi:hypothetical protein C8R46DRAFT_1108415 [Mycena filopes]|nr:hypothetical protein C8R46DRAFT_1108415 [Mycena filopes]